MKLRLSAILLIGLLFFVIASCQLRVREIAKCNKLNLQNGIKISETKDYTTFKCKNGYTSNVERLENRRFKCFWASHAGSYVLSDEFALIETEKVLRELYLNDVTCERKSTCPTPPNAINDNMGKVLTSRYMLTLFVNKKLQAPAEIFHTGDTIDYPCKKGSIRKAIQADTQSEEEYDGDDYYAYDEGSDEAEVKPSPMTDRLTCQQDGKWTTEQEVNLGTCEPITCDAKGFQFIYDGNITNYKDKYSYGETMRLECNPGFTPINRVSEVACWEEDSFGYTALKEFGCQEIECPEPSTPLFGSKSVDDKGRVGDTIEFQCQYGYRLIGNANWTCLPTGHWDASCVVCTKDELYCHPPCTPPATKVTNHVRDIYQGSVIEYGCTSGKQYGGNTSRQCLYNTQWTGEPLDCTGESLYDADIGFVLKQSLGKIPFSPNSSIDIDNNSNDTAEGRMINVGQAGGVDLFIALDTSNSITEERFNMSKEFVRAILHEVGISNEDIGTRLAMIYFATEIKEKINEHFLEGQELSKNYSSVLKKIGIDDSLANVREATKSGTDIVNVLNFIGEKLDGRMSPKYRMDAQQVLIVISDGEYTQSGNPKPIADGLKKENDLEIYSIFVGEPSNSDGVNTMKELASDSMKPDETHFFILGEQQLDTVISAMVNGVGNEIAKCNKLNLQNGIKISETKDYTTFKCKNGYTSNVERLENRRFKCFWASHAGSYVLSDEFALIETEKVLRELYLNDVTCERKSTCPTPPNAINDNMGKVLTSRYMLTLFVNKKLQAPAEIFHTGDTIDYPCKKGSIRKAIQADTQSEEEYDGDDYYAYDEGSDEAEVKPSPMTDRLTCQQDGKWTTEQEVNLGTCEPITCDAKGFQFIYDGNITNYKDKYSYGETMRLECNPGFTPINRVSEVACWEEDSFGYTALKEFGCQEIECPEPSTPLFGSKSVDDKGRVGDTIEFQCQYGYRLIGNANWTCLPTGHWDASCVVCTKDELYCHPPCTPPATKVTNHVRDIYQGSVIEYGCTSGKQYGGNTSRQCLYNTQWTGEPLDCTGESLYDADIGFVLKQSLGKIPFSPNSSIDIDNNSNDTAEGRMINVGQAGGVDLFIALDTSNSITEERFNMSKEFVRAILHEVGISNEDIGTRLAMIYFATEIKEKINEHFLEGQELSKNYSSVLKKIGIDDSLANVREATKSGTDIVNVLNFIGEKLDGRMSPKYRMDAQQVLIVISDGEYTQSGNPKPIADGLKKENDLEIYSIFVGEPSNSDGVNTMKELASDSMKPDETHFFILGEQQLDTVISAMVNGVGNEIAKCNKLNLQNGIKISETKDYTTFKCKNGYTSNVERLENRRFKCFWASHAGSYVLSDEFALIETEKVLRELYLNDVTCERKSTCPTPPNAINDNMGKVLTSRYMLTLFVNKKLQAPAEIFHTGDTIDYPCKKGSIRKAIQADTQSEEEYDGDDYYAYDEGSDEAEVKPSPMTDRLTCQQDGKWTTEQEVNLGTCEPITCDAKGFQFIYDGNITNYKDKYSYGETMRLECNPGFTPINRVSEVACWEEDSFGYTALKEFGCQEIECPEPSTPLFGSKSVDDKGRVGDTIEFQCQYGYRLIGNANWTCLPTGHWDASCVVCTKDELYCHPPCTPPATKVTNHVRDIYQGSVIEYGCTSGKQYGGNTSRQCLYNTQWTGEPLDCTGESLYDADIGFVLKQSLGKIPFSPNSSIDIDNNSNDTAEGRMINVGQAGGVDLFIALDTSNSITEERFNMSKEFVRAILHEVGISNEDIGTRLAMIYFATEIKEKINEHFLEGQELSKNYSSVLKKIGIDDSLANVREATKSGTDIVNVLNFIGEKLDGRKSPKYRMDAQQVLIVISDGEYTQSDNPKPIADGLKKENDLEIYSIFVGEPSNSDGVNTMKELASDSMKPDETHFFILGEQQLDTVISAMVNGVGNDTSCGMTKPTNTLVNQLNYKKEPHESQENAWPWMAQFFKNTLSTCGGSLISNRWILTAAHCFVDKEFCPDKVILRSHKRLISDKKSKNEEYIPREVKYDCGEDVVNSNVYIHEQFDIKAEPKYQYDIALVKLPEKVEFDNNLKPVCLYELKETGDVYPDNIIEEDKTFGIVTGYGDRCKDNTDKCEPFDVLKQMQMKVQSQETCTKSLKNIKNSTASYNKSVMFCAGDDGVDACSGDSGGPFVVQYPPGSSKYLQIGIVSFGFSCNVPDRYGFYTKLTQELLNWIKKTMKNNN